MALVIKDRVKETSTTTGTGTLTLAGATTGYQSFSTAIGNTNTTYYTISTPTGSEWEVGIGTVAAGTLARTSILASSNGGSAVNFSAGVKDVFGTYPAGKAVYSDIESDITINTLRVGLGGGAVATNTAVGFQAINASATGTSNVAVGYQAVLNTTSGANNTGIGTFALQANTTGAGNVGVGRSALLSNTTASNNTAVGHQALLANTTGSSNTAVGYLALVANSTGTLNVGLGTSALTSNTTNTNNTSVGHASLLAADAANNTALGTNSGRAITTGAQNTLLGSAAAFSGTNNLTTGSNNTIIGYNAAASSATVSNEITLGNASVTSLRVPGIAATFGTSNSTISTLTVGKGGGAVATNTAIGYQAINAIATGTLNTAVGYQALKALTSGLQNVAIGSGALIALTSGLQNIAVGNSTLSQQTSGSNNTAVGHGALYQSGNSASNSAVGRGSLSSATGGGNTALGDLSGGAVTTGATNTLLGYLAANSGTNNLTTGSNNIIIGYNAAASAATVSNEVTIGNSSITTVRIPGVGFTATTNGFGYATGSGGAVTQATSRTTGVTLNKTNGAITLVSAAGLITYQSFTVTNSTVAATDTIIVNQKSGTDKNIILVTNVAAGSFEITFATTGGLTTEQPVFNFAVIKAVTA
jgi:hypothetical protein